MSANRSMSLRAIALRAGKCSMVLRKYWRGLHPRAPLFWRFQPHRFALVSSSGFARRHCLRRSEANRTIRRSQAEHGEPPFPITTRRRRVALRNRRWHRAVADACKVNGAVMAHGLVALLAVPMHIASRRPHPACCGPLSNGLFPLQVFTAPRCSAPAGARGTVRSLQDRPTAT